MFIQSENMRFMIELHIWFRWVNAIMAIQLFGSETFYNKVILINNSSK